MLQRGKMKSILKIWIIAFISTALPIISWYSYNIFILENCDPKLGCIGSFGLILIMYNIFAIMTAFSFAASFYIVHKKNKNSLNKPIYLMTIFKGVLLSSLTTLYFQNSILSHIFHMI